MKLFNLFATVATIAAAAVAFCVMNSCTGADARPSEEQGMYDFAEVVSDGTFFDADCVEEVFTDTVSAKIPLRGVVYTDPDAGLYKAKIYLSQKAFWAVTDFCVHNGEGYIREFFGMLTNGRKVGGVTVYDVDELFMECDESY